MKRLSALFICCLLVLTRCTSSPSFLDQNSELSSDCNTSEIIQDSESSVSKIAAPQSNQPTVGNMWYQSEEALKLVAHSSHCCVIPYNEGCIFEQAEDETCYKPYKIAIADNKGTPTLTDLGRFTIVMPQFVPISGYNLEAVNQQLQQYVQLLAEEDQKTFFEVLEWDIDKYGGDVSPSCYYANTYNYVFGSEDFLSAYCFLETYTGYPRTSYFLNAKTFNPKTGKQLAMDDLFTVSRDSYMERIEEIISSYEGIGIGHVVTLSIKEQHNPEDFMVNGDRLIVFFQRYTIVAGNAGIIMYEIPLDNFQDILIPLTE